MAHCVINEQYLEAILAATFGKGKEIKKKALLSSDQLLHCHKVVLYTFPLNS